ncbi:hypothetical protein ANN_19616 [Periplaneta americana]|uniref:Uncharacterized protein n=1 Tax=Periplaneta americana TaxID=6978 RepID=A0ABQ8SAE2_PERAM|nr:hypothetical protein ANN_19616 [Periplaneta americana]
MKQDDVELEERDEGKEDVRILYRCRIGNLLEAFFGLAFPVKDVKGTLSRRKPLRGQSVTVQETIGGLSEID